MSWARRVALGAWVVAATMAVAWAALAILRGSSDDLQLVLMAPLLILGYATVGRVIVSRHPRNPIGWIMIWIGAFAALAILSEEYVLYGVETLGRRLPGAELAAWVSPFALPLAVGAVPPIFLLFPSGRAPTARWRPVAWIYGVAIVLGAAGQVIRPEHLVGNIPNPTGAPAMEGMSDVLLTMAAFGSIGAALVFVAAPILRYRRASGEERQQLRWLAYVAALCALTFLLTGLAEWITDDVGSAVGDVTFTLFVATLAVGVPVASGVAILRYRLYDLDVVVKKTVVAGLVVLFVVGSYFGLIWLLNAMFLGGSGRAGVVTLLITVAVALAYPRVREGARHVADRLVYGRRATPYQVLAELSERVAGAYSTDDVLPRMAQIVSSGTGATRAEVWLRAGREFHRAAGWPEDDADPHSVLAGDGDELPDFPQATHAFPVRHRGELLGALSVAVPPSDPLTTSQEKLIRDLAGQAGLVLQNVQLIEDLRESRRRIVAAQDERARKIERNIHDGAQQQLVAIAVKLRLAEQLADRDPAKARAMLAELQLETNDALENLRDLARGIYPPLLADRGLGAALDAQARKSPVAVTVEAGELGRYLPEIEAAVYFSCLEALQNVAKYAQADSIRIQLSQNDHELSFSIEDDGVGFDPATISPGSGLTNIRDRIEALRGSIEIRSTLGEGTTVAGRIPASMSEGQR